MKHPFKFISIPLGVTLAILTLWFSAAYSTQASTGLRYVAVSGSDGGNDCSAPSNPCATIQHAIDVAAAGEELRIAGGQYAPGGTVAVIDKELRLVGSFDPSFTAPDPDSYPTTLDAGGNGSVIKVSNAGDAFLQHLIITHGDGNGNCSPLVAGCGGGIYATGSDLHVVNCTISDNVASSVGGGNGGGIYADANAHLAEIMDSYVISNTAAPSSTQATQYGYGGGIFIYQGTASIVGNTISANLGSANHGGSGGLHLAQVIQADVSNNIITGNRSNANTYWSEGGGIDIQYSHVVTVSNNDIENNHAALLAGYGGGINVWESDAYITANTIISNTTGSFSGYGGGVSINSSLPVTLTNNLIAKNFAGTTGGGVAEVKYGAPVSQAVLVNNTIVNNGATGVAGSRYAHITLTNNLIAGQDEGLVKDTPTDVVFTADTNLFWNTSDPNVGANAIQAAPLLTPDYRLSDGSPALNAGLAISWLTTDLAGDPRPQGSGYDIGAYEGAWHLVFLPLVIKDSSGGAASIVSDDFALSYYFR